MKKLLIILTLLFTFNSVYSQTIEKIDPSLYGYWINMDNEVLIIQPNNTFTRRNGSETISKGKLQVVDGELLVIRTDIETEYSLGFVVREDIFVVAKPDSSQAWVFTRL
jgi:hypothetical protein